MFCNSDHNFTKKKNFGLNKSFRYRIFDSTNILPMFFVMFNPQSSLPAFSSRILCQECEIKDADHYCKNDDCYFCAECSNHIHLERHMTDHEKIPVRKSQKPGKCYFDQDKDVEFFCRNCNLPICSYCKVIGSHSSIEANSHLFEDITSAFLRFSPESNEVIKFSEEKRKKAFENLVKIKNQVE